MLTAQIIVQVVSWPLVGLLCWTVLRRRRTTAAARDVPAVPVIATVVVVGANAILALDATGETTVSRVCATLMGWGTALLLATYPTGGPVPRWTIGVVALVYVVETANLMTGFGLEAQPWWPWHHFAWVLQLLFAQLLRYRLRSDARQRQQVRWVLATYLSMMAAFMVMLFAETGGLIRVGHTSPIAVVLLVLPGLGFSFGLLAPGSANVDRALRWIVTVGGWLFIVSGTIAATGGWPGERGRWASAALIALAALAGWMVMTWLGRRIVYGARPDTLRVLDDLDELLAAHHDATAVPE